MTPKINPDETVDLRVLAARHAVYASLDGSELIEAGVALLLAGDESEAVVDLAGMRRADGPLDIRAVFGRVLRVHHIPSPTFSEALMTLTRRALEQFVRGEREAIDVAGEIGSYFELRMDAPTGFLVLLYIVQEHDEPDATATRRAELVLHATERLAVLAAELGVT